MNEFSLIDFKNKEIISEIDENNTYLFSKLSQNILYIIFFLLSFLIFVNYYSSGIIFDKDVLNEKYTFINPFKGYFSQNLNLIFNSLLPQHEKLYIRLNIIRFKLGNF